MVRSFLKVLAEVSRDVAIELQNETRVKWNKGTYKLDLHEAPPVRILALILPLAAWLGWIMREKHGENSRPFSSNDCLDRICKAYEYGIDLSKKGERP